MGKQRLFGRLPSHRRFAQPVTITVERDTNGTYIAYENETYQYGYAPTKLEAVAEYKRALIEYFVFLSREEEHLSSRLHQELEWMRQRITHR